MPEVTLKINGRGYGLACEEGQEQRLSDLSHYVDSRLQDIAAAGAATNESHLLVLTSLVLADEIYELRDEIASLRQSGDVVTYGGISPNEEQMIAGSIEHLATKIEAIASRIHGEENIEAA